MREKGARSDDVVREVSKKDGRPASCLGRDFATLLPPAALSVIFHAPPRRSPVFLIGRLGCRCGRSSFALNLSGRSLNDRRRRERCCFVNLTPAPLTRARGGHDLLGWYSYAMTCKKMNSWTSWWVLGLKCYSASRRRTE